MDVDKNEMAEMRVGHEALNLFHSHSEKFH